MVFYALLTAQRSSRSGAPRRRRVAAPVISAGWRGRAGGDAAAPVIELRTAPFRSTSETASGQFVRSHQCSFGAIRRPRWRRRLFLVSLQTLARIANFRLRSAERCV